MDVNIVAIATSFCASMIAMSCGIRYLLRRCCYPRKERSLQNYTTQYYIHTANSTQCSRFYFDERNQIRSMVITASIQPSSEQGGPQFVGFVLEPSVLEPEHSGHLDPPRYEDALKLAGAPPQYEEQSTGSSSPERSIDLPPSGRTTARMDSSIDEVSSCDGEGEVMSPRPSRSIREEH